MSRSVSHRSIHDADKTAGFWFKIGVWPFFLVLAVFFVTLFMLNVAMQLEGYEFYGTLSQWYIFIGFFGFMAITFVMAKESGKTYQTVVFDDPYRSWKDFLSVIVGVIFGIGLLALVQAGLPFQQTVEIPEPILQLLVATIEETTFRLALPALIYIGLHESKVNISATLAFVLAIIAGNMAFSVFHYASYQLIIDNAQAILAAGMINGIPLNSAQIAHYTAVAATPFLDTLISAFIFGMLQSFAFFFAIRLGGSGGEWAILGLIGGHYIWNLLMASIQLTGGAALYNPWEYLGLFLIIIFMFQFSIGYFFRSRSATVGSHRRKNQSRIESFLSFIPSVSSKKKRRYIK